MQIPNLNWIEQDAPQQPSALPPFEFTLGAILIRAKEAVIAPLRPLLRRHGITEPQWRVMRIIRDRAAVNASKIAELGCLLLPSVSRILDELERRELLVRTADQDDRRMAVISLSEAGAKLVENISVEMAAILERRARSFGAKRTEHLIGELRDLLASIDDD